MAAAPVSACGMRSGGKVDLETFASGARLGDFFDERLRFLGLCEVLGVIGRSESVAETLVVGVTDLSSAIEGLLADSPKQSGSATGAPTIICLNGISF